ncbi:hypothetical protein EJ08DRAFT_658846 [Tothia fuscella]|uniref:Uncharacterized protein n=1 Tax=Tothia fuscella TaxID=1048955 RepID=A0A9P4NWE1_9PEZI|nr:hypothetical protein EJ08DRAFT_658846 [Tothia fuscella]
MSNHLDTAAAVSAVVSAFHGGVDSVKQIRKRSKKRKGEQFIKEKLLQEALESGEAQVSERYTQYFQEIGEQFKSGDAIGREKLLHLAVVMQSELIRSLQIAVQYENAVLDLTKLQEDAVISRRDTLSCLDELRNRLLQDDHSSSPQAPMAPNGQMFPQRQSHEPTQKHQTSKSISSDFVPPGVKMVDEEEAKLSGFSRLLSMRRSSKKDTDSTPRRASVTPNLDWLSPAIRPNVHPTARPTEYELPAADVKRAIVASATQYLHPAMARDPPISRHVSTNSSSSTATSRSDFSDEKIPVLVEEEEGNSPATAVEIAGALPPQHYLQSHHSRYRSSSNNSFKSPAMSPISTISPTSPLPPLAVGSIPETTNAFRRWSAGRPISSAASNRSSIYSQRTSSISVPSTASSASTAMLGRPSKENSYWGFCKGSWTCREDWRKGLHVQTIPAGIYATQSVWRCKHCHFEGSIFGEKKPYSVDTRVYTAQESGVKYRWVFLAKSHVRKGHKVGDSTCFGCIVCAAEGKGTSIFGDVETLCKHLVAEHGRIEMSEEMQKRNRCIVGRSPTPSEDFDFCIPGEPSAPADQGRPLTAPARFSDDVQGMVYA